MQERKKEIPNPAFDHSSEFKSEGVNKEENTKAEPEVSEIDTIGKYTFATLAIGESASRYIAIFKKITQGNFIIPSKPAGIFGLAWLVYRRASFYGAFVYSLLVLIAYELVTKAVFLPKVAQVVAIFGFTHVVFYFIGNFLYWYSVRKKIDSYREKYGDTSAMTYLSEKGGTVSGFNLIAAVLMLQGTMLLIVAGGIYIDDFMMGMWTGFLELAHLKG